MNEFHFRTRDDLFFTLCVVLLCLCALPLSSARADTPSPLVINEVFVDGSSNYPDWIELYNRGDVPLSLKGYILTKNVEEQQWPIRADFVCPPRGYKVFYCDKKDRYDHTSFRLTSVTGEIGLFSPEGELIDSVSYNDLPRFTSLGRWPDGGDTFYIHASPTKGSANQESSVLLAVDTDIPILFSPPGGMYEDAVELNVSVPEGMQVRYTTDGTIPEATSLLLTGPLSLSETTAIRVAAVSQEGKVLARKISSYIVNEPGNLPVVSVVTAPKNLWDPEIGIYTEGDSPQKGESFAPNWSNNWRRPVHIEFFSAVENWSVDGKTRIFGGASRGRPQKSFAVYTTSKKEPYGLQRQLFPHVERENYAGFILRNGGDAWLRTQIRDAFIQSLVENRVACDIMPYRPVVVYLNGSYWGVYGLREFMMRKNLLARHDLPIQRISLMDGGGQVASAKGPFANMGPIPVEGDYKPALSQLDVDAFLDYLAVELYSGNPDWPDGNIKCWRPESKEIKWQWILFDLDRGFNGKRGKGPEVDPFTKLYQRQGGRGLMFAQLAENTQFVKDFCGRLIVHMLTTFDPDRSMTILDRIAGDIRPEMQRHIDRWRWDWKPDRLFMTVGDWEQNLEGLREYCRQRPQAMLSILDKRFAVGKPVYTKIRIDKQGEGMIVAEGVPLDDGILQGLVPENMEITISAVPASGYVFAGWKMTPGSKQPQIHIQAGKAFTDCALFKPSIVQEQHNE